MKVEGKRPVSAIPSRKDVKGPQGGFADALRTGEAAAPAPAAGPAPVAGIDGLFALQEVGDSGSDQAASERGEQILQRLDDLRIGLLMGRIGSDKLTQLVRLTQNAARQATDPRLKEVLAEIDLRAHVELAKLEHRDD